MDDATAEAPTDHRDELAEERTRLARERTTLAYIRTGFAAFLFGLALLSLIDHPLAQVAGGLSVLVGLTFLGVGWRSYMLSNRRTRHLLAEVERPLRRR